MRAIILLIHSPLVGPFTWQPAAVALKRRGFHAIVPTLTSPPGSAVPYWERHAQEVANALAAFPADQPLILVGHSGAGPLLPAIRQALRQPVSGYIFVDAGLPVDGLSRLDRFGDPSAADRFRQSAVNGLLPAWTEEDLREVIPGDAVRQRFAAELNPLPLAVYEEPLPVFSGWPDAPCAYLQFGANPAYTAEVERARQLGWKVAYLEGDHFHMLVDPEQVAGALLELSGKNMHH